MRIDINGHRLNIEVHGAEDGKPVVLLHHGLGSVRAWRGQIPALVEAGWKTIVYDRWGYGDSDPREGFPQPRFEADLADLEALLEELVPGENARLVGHSDGGTIALYYAAQHPERTAAVVAAAAHIYVEDKMQAGIAGVKGMYEQDARFPEGLRRMHGEKFHQVFQNWFNGWRRAENLKWDMRPLLSGIRCPVLVIQGTEDEHAAPKHAEDLAACIPGAELWLVEGAGHMLPQDLSDAFNRRMIQFLESSDQLSVNSKR